MLEEKTIIEKRRHRRFHVRNGSYAALKNHSSTMGRIVNISKGGLAFRFMDSGEDIQGIHEMDIIIADSDFYLRGLQFLIISDHYIDNINPFSTIIMRHCGGQFSELKKNQISQLEYFIAGHAVY